jgi:hypothetical protein
MMGFRWELCNRWQRSEQERGEWRARSGRRASCTGRRVWVVASTERRNLRFELQRGECSQRGSRLRQSSDRFGGDRGERRARHQLNPTTLRQCSNHSRELDKRTRPGAAHPRSRRGRRHAHSVDATVLVPTDACDDWCRTPSGTCRARGASARPGQWRRASDGLLTGGESVQSAAIMGCVRVSCSSSKRPAERWRPALRMRCACCGDSFKVIDSLAGRGSPVESQKLPEAVSSLKLREDVAQSHHLSAGKWRQCAHSDWLEKTRASSF